MSSKVIKWFKRQASIRRHSEKAEEKSSSSNTKPEEKRKTSFPRLSFRKRNKRKGSDIEGGLSIIGISKKFSFSVPKEMESHTKEPLDSRVPTSHSTNFAGSVSLTNSPNRMVDQSTCSEFSNQSSFDDNLKENTVSMNESEATKTEQNKNGNESVSRTFNYGDQHSPQCISTESRSNTSLNNFYENTKQENAPIVKMEEICDSYSDKELPEETQSITAIDSSINNVSYQTEIVESVCTNKTNNYNLYDNLNLQLTKLKCDESVLYIEKEMDSKDSGTEINLQQEKKQLENVFEEIDRLVKDAASIADFESNDDCHLPQYADDHREININSNEEIEETEVHKSFDQTNNSSNTETDENIGNSDSTELVKEVVKKEGVECRNEVEQEIAENVVSNHSRNSSKDISTLSMDDSSTSISQLPINAVNGHDEVVVEEHPSESKDINNMQSLLQINGNDQENNKKYDNSEEGNTDNEPELHETLSIEEPENEIELKIIEESDFKEPNVNHKVKPNIKEISNIKNGGPESPISHVQITFTHPSPVKRKESPKIIEEKLSTNNYPEELNPFGDDDVEDKESKATSSVSSNNCNNFEVTPRKIPQSHTKENECSSFSRETPKNNLTPRRNMKSSSSSPQLKTSHPERGQHIKESYDRSLNPFGESDEEDVPSSLNSTNPFDEEQDLGRNPPSSRLGEAPPRLPPKSTDLQTRKNSKGYLPPIPHPRRSKQSHHGSYTSLQNVSTAPIPAPRSITPFGSTKTLNLSLNPFDDEDDDESRDFTRGGVGRSSLQALHVTSSLQEPLARTGVRASLPPTSKIKLGRKKRLAPLPPGFNQNKPVGSVFHFGSLPRRRYSSSASDMPKIERKYPSSRSREESPQRMPPPRPPPPKYK